MAMMARPRYSSGLVRCPSCRMFNRSKDQCIFCDYSPAAQQSQNSTHSSLAEVALSAMRARRGATTPKMTPRALSDICKQHGAPTCNLAVVQLHLNCVGFDAIDACISNYPAVESLWLERNKLERIEHLEELKQLRCLGLNNNLITRVEGVSHLARLTMLNLSSNRLKRLEGLDSLKSLNILLVADNQLRTKDDIAHLEGEGGRRERLCTTSPSSHSFFF